MENKETAPEGTVAYQPRELGFTHSTAKLKHVRWQQQPPASPVYLKPLAVQQGVHYVT